jgi:hypothetical protein
VAVRKRLYHPDEVREKIQTSQLVNRLNSFVNGEIELSPHQVTAALGLIRKTMPDLASTEHSGEVSVPFVMAIPVVAATVDEWSDQHEPRQLQS